ncbi:CofH family radical SAM protein [bacterium]|nr:CofH family radical SAM protein [bacterium]MCP5462266.1 CofH family radical SAM protein [bacterium]
MENTIRRKVESGARISDAEALWLLTQGDLHFMGEMANIRRREKVGDNAYYQFNFNLNHTTICELECELCAYYNNKSGYTMKLPEIEDAVRAASKKGANEVHIVGGLNPNLPFSYFIEMCQRIKGIDKNMHIQAFTTVEIDYFAKRSGKTTLQVLQELKDAGLDTLPGGGAEIFAQRVRDIICSKKISGQAWLDIMEEAHSVGIPSNATMLYGHVETPEEIIDHMRRLREVQDRTGGFFAFVPLAFFPQNTKIPGVAVGNFTSGVLDMKIISLGRIYLDNFDHVKSMWMIYGYKGCQVGLDYGADDIGGTYFDEIIVHAAGAETPKSVSKPEIIDLIKKMGRTPIEVNSKYQPVCVTV